MSIRPAFHRIGAPGVASLEQAGPTTATISGWDASLVAAVCPPSALHPESSAINFYGMVEQRTALILDREFYAALLIDAERRVRPRKDPVAAEHDRRALGDHQDANVVGHRALVTAALSGGKH